ncbi:hypothetical protein MCOR25_009814 [Pyricularia grisea]|uniref:1-acyl-sn-glycerol-3-phosphate acyltransferase n=1 Tax=Pyricularia grisea TaxID=148305 RepID=A0A6P8AR96_PYRGI|nr:uncharacterized protein PgNI_09376 [Pyricularia grisea]KAI6351650.1 hypothetical protein MCOR25_009814 [Pyricularia grisea]TLD04630.1 hypothetical protein PgNI_09376 [Pyricularia grisea]
MLEYLYYFAGGYTSLVIGLYMLSFAIPKAAFVARILASYICLLVAASFGVVCSIILRLFGAEQNAQHYTARVFMWLMLFATGVTFEIIDPKGHLSKEENRPAVLVGNHQTELDVLMLGCLFPEHCSVTAKASLRRTPFLGWFMSLSGTIFIDRKNSADARQAMSGAVTQIRTKRQTVYIFPEGTRSYTREPMLLPFKKGAFHLAVQAQVPIVPCVVANYSHVLWIKGLVFNAGKIPVKVLDPIPTTGMTAADVDGLCKKTYDLMHQELITLTSKARGEPVTVPSSMNPTGIIEPTNGKPKHAS